MAGILLWKGFNVNHQHQSTNRSFGTHKLYRYVSGVLSVGFYDSSVEVLDAKNSLCPNTGFIWFMCVCVRNLFYGNRSILLASCPLQTSISSKLEIKQKLVVIVKAMWCVVVLVGVVVVVAECGTECPTTTTTTKHTDNNDTNTCSLKEYSS